jgi:hypothetical protein
MYVPTLGMVGIAGLLFILVVMIVLLLRRLVVSGEVARITPIWGCGYGAVNPRMQYTASSYANSVFELAEPLLDVDSDYQAIPKTVYFPTNKLFATHPHDPVEHRLLVPVVRRLTGIVQIAGVVQTGRVHHYVLYAFLYILLLFGLTVTGVFG